MNVLLTEAKIIALRRATAATPVGHERRWADTLAFARAVAHATAEACAFACRAQMTDKADDEWNKACAACAEASKEQGAC